MFIAAGIIVGFPIFIVLIPLAMEIIFWRKVVIRRPIFTSLYVGVALGLLAIPVTLGLTMLGLFGRYESAMGGFFLAFSLPFGAPLPALLAGLVYRLLGTTVLGWLQGASHLRSKTSGR